MPNNESCLADRKYVGGDFNVTGRIVYSGEY